MISVQKLMRTLSAKRGRFSIGLTAFLSIVAANVLADPGDRALERLSSQLPSDDGLVITRYLIDELPMYRLDAAGRPIFDPTLLSAVIHNAAGPDAWGEGTWLIVTRDRSGILVRQDLTGQTRIAAAMRNLYEQRGILPTHDIVPNGKPEPE